MELKKGDRQITFIELFEQVRKYHKIMNALAREIDPNQTPNFEIIVLLGKFPASYSKEDIESLERYKARVMTYTKLIEHAKASYKEWLNAQDKITRIQQIVDKL